MDTCALVGRGHYFRRCDVHALWSALHIRLMRVPNPGRAATPGGGPPELKAAGDLMALSPASQARDSNGVVNKAVAGAGTQGQQAQGQRRRRGSQQGHIMGGQQPYTSLLAQQNTRHCRWRSALLPLTYGAAARARGRKNAEADVSRDRVRPRK